MYTESRHARRQRRAQAAPMPGQLGIPAASGGEAPQPAGAEVAGDAALAPGTAAVRRAVHAGWARMLSGYFPDGSDSAYVTLTWSDTAARSRGVHGPKSALRDVKDYLRDVGITQFFLAVEQTDRANVPHVHGIVRVGGMASRRWLWGAWYGTRKSMARILPVQDGCLSYVTKYVLKDELATSLDWSL